VSLLSDKETFLDKHHIDETQYNLTGLKWEEVAGIFEAYVAEAPLYNALERYFSDCLHSLASVHSVITSLKDPEQLIATLIGKKITNPKLVVGINNYHEIVTDLITVRVLYTFKEDWAGIHEYITDKWALKEKPIAYLCPGDDCSEEGKKLLANFRDKGCAVQYREDGDRSIAYTVNSGVDNKTTCVEILTRTIFEEGWSSVARAVADAGCADDLMRRLSHAGRQAADMAVDMSSCLYHAIRTRPASHPEESQPDSKEDETLLSNLTQAPITAANQALNSNETEPAPQQDFLAALDHHIKQQTIDADPWQVSIAQPPATQRNAEGSGSAREQLPVPDILQDGYPPVQPSIMDPQREDAPENEGDSQKFTLLKLKQAIQGITTKKNNE
jgi:ppGpp synthetase/RelA/SpoT-type nucleotidyltranferase